VLLWNEDLLEISWQRALNLIFKLEVGQGDMVFFETHSAPKKLARIPTQSKYCPLTP